MSCSYYAHAIIGLKLNRNQLYKTQKVKAFKHNYTEDVNYCPKTGKPCWTTEEIELIEEIDKQDLISTEQDEEHVYWTAITVTASDWREPRFSQFTTLDLNKIDAFKEKAAQLDLWDESKFGLYSVLSISC